MIAQDHACSACGAPLRPIEGWTLTIPPAIASMNSNRMQNAGPSRWRYAKHRDAITTALMVARQDLRIPKATEKRRAIITRLYAGRQRPLDRGNLVAGCKALLDAMTRAELIVDDSERWLEDHYRQVKAPTSGTMIDLAIL